jgi:hypothetical protein
MSAYDRTEDAGEPLRPHRGGAVLALGILGLAVCFICGIIAWVMGNEDLRAMREGRMDPSGESMTSAGRICGMISVFLAIAGIVIGIVILLAGGAAGYSHLH